MSGPPSPPARHDPCLALRNANYRAFLGGFLPASTGLQMLATALGWEVWDRTHDELLLGYLGLARAIPVVLLVLPAGHLADLRDRRRILIATQSSFALLTALLALASGAAAPLWLVFAVVVATGCTRSFHGPARNALLPQLVRDHELQNAATWNSGAFQVAALAGPLLAGGLIDLCGHAWPVYASTSALCGIAALQALRLRPRERAHGGSGRFTLAAMTAGASHLGREKTVLAAIALDLFAVLLGGATALLPVYQHRLGMGAIGLGALRAAPEVGALLVALLLARRPPFRRAGPALLLSVAGFGAATIGFGLSTSFPLSLLLLAALGGLDNVSVVIRSVLVQVRTPESLRGRVSAVNSLFIECSNELGAFESCGVAKLFGPVFSVVSGGFGTIAVVMGIAWLCPDVRRLGRIEPPAG